MNNKNLTQEQIEELERKYINKYYHFLKFAEDEMLEGFKTKDDMDESYRKKLSFFEEIHSKQTINDN